MTDTPKTKRELFLEAAAIFTALAAAEVAEAAEPVTPAPPVVPKPPAAPAKLLSGAPKLLIGEAIALPGEREAQVIVRLQEPLTRQLSFDYLTKNGTAKQDYDFKRAGGPLTFRPGETEKVIKVPLLRDLGDKTFTIEVTWSKNIPPIPGVAGVIKGGTSREPVVLTPQPTFAPAAQRNGRTRKFATTFQEAVTPFAQAGAWRSRPSWGRVQTNNKEIAPYVHASTDPGTNPHPIVDGKRVLRVEHVPVQEGAVTYPFAGAMMTSQHLFTFQYGLVELTAMIARAQGTIPAFWLIPADGVTWPPELDFEWGLGDKPNLTRTDHTREGAAVPQEGQLIASIPDGEFHTYAFDWTPTELISLVDGVEVHRRKFAFDFKAQIILNIGVGGILAPAPKEPIPAGWKSEMTLDRLEVWQ